MSRFEELVEFCKKAESAKTGNELNSLEEDIIIASNVSTGLSLISGILGNERDDVPEVIQSKV